MRRLPATAALLASAAVLSACAAGTAQDGGSADAGGPGTTAAAIALPPTGGVFDYQLGGAYEPAGDVTIVARDRTDDPAPGVYGICYVNLFQTQPDADDGPDPAASGTTAWWEAEHPGLLLRDASGALVVDADWDEALFDIRTAENREALLAIQGEWIEGCAEAGFDAVEPDNLDQHERSDGLQTLDDTTAYMRLVIPIAHDLGLAVAQKNTAGLGDDGPTLVSSDPAEGFDFAVAEECELYDECDAYPYPGVVLEVEYSDTGDVTRDGRTQSAFAWACERRAGEHPITLRDRDVVTPDDPAYVFEHC
ncbi:endo alpha-1,4 polygalactosaminidase [Microbacterium betulae]|uniref:Endo alpha-1,4 polygalactosaminidase n=1 Tax=Microbacterium betulae TaxID=2981139 RepID=A0AA97FHH7_9MICO|nr:endo alpha-1,4 polygalactosaminidase [Microbacterium sp. AB]WOF22773.1 endo alpha-1,4 polygalactosaminidase [Microbacterium sp. AB]